MIKSTVKYDVGIVECDNGTIKCEKKIGEPPNVTKEKSHIILELHNVRMKLLNVRKNIGTAKCDKSTITCDFGSDENMNVRSEKLTDLLHS